MTGEPGARERLRWLTQHTRILVLALALLAIAVAAAAYSFGVFTTSTANPETTFTSGTMTQVSSHDNEAILAASDMVPGSIATGEATLRNAGDASGDFVMHTEDLADDPGPGGGRLSQALQLRVTQDADPDLVYEGRLDEFGTESLGRWDPEEARTFTFTVTLGPVGNAYQESAASVTFVWDATQAP